MPPQTLWAWLPAIPMLVLAVAELGRVPLASVLFHRQPGHAGRGPRRACVVLGYLAVENWTFGFERIVELRLKPVSAAGLAAVARPRADQTDLINHRDQANDGRTAASERNCVDGIRTAWTASRPRPRPTRRTSRRSARRAAWSASSAWCRAARAEDQRYDAMVQPADQGARRSSSPSSTIWSRRTAAAWSDLDKDDRGCGSASRATRRRSWQDEVSEQPDLPPGGQLLRVNTTDVTRAQFATARWVFSTFSAIAVAVAGSVPP